MQNGLYSKLAKLRSQPQPLRFLASRLLWRSGLCSILKIPCDSYCLRFYPTAYSATLWLNPNERLRDEAIFRSLLREGDTVVDVGANVGTLTLTASRIVGPTGKVYSVEAHPRTHKYLVGNLRLNDVKNVETFNVACGVETGTTIFSDGALDDQNAVSTEGLRVPIRRLDDLVTATEMREIALLKVDVEGYEKFVLEGAHRLLPRVKFIYFESYDRHFATFGYKLSDIVSLLKQFQFDLYHLDGKGVPRDYNSTLCENLLAARSRPTI